jgi:hypothetical protein
VYWKNKRPLCLLDCFLHYARLVLLCAVVSTGGMNLECQLPVVPVGEGDDRLGFASFSFIYKQKTV